MSDSQNELFLVDGSGFIFRAYFAMTYSGRGDMTNPNGVPVSAVFGFTQMLMKLLKDYHAPYIAVIFDAKGGSFRNEIYPDYKANREAPPEDLVPQFPLVRDATRAFDIPAIESWWQTQVALRSGPAPRAELRAKEDSDKKPES